MHVYTHTHTHTHLAHVHMGGAPPPCLQTPFLSASVLQSVTSPRRISVPVLVKEENATKGSSSSSSGATGEGKLSHHRDSSSNLGGSNTSSLLPSHLTCDSVGALDHFRTQGSATPVTGSAFPSMTPLHHNVNNAYLHHQRAW